MKLVFSALTKLICGILLVGVLLFLPAGTLDYPNGMLFAAILFIPMLLLGLFLFIKSPELLKKRLDTNEKEKTQKCVVALSLVGFACGFVMAGLDFRFGLSRVPTAVVVIAAVVFLLGYAMYAEVMRENAYLSRSVKVQSGQKVVSTGLYGVVRHPMYLATLIMFLAMPLVLGSWYSFVIFMHYPVLIVVRIVNEEKLLTADLVGYAEYKQKVRYRLIPLVW